MSREFRLSARLQPALTATIDFCLLIGPGARSERSYYIHIVDLFDGLCPPEHLGRYKVIMNAASACSEPEDIAAVVSEVADLLPGVTRAEIIQHVMAAAATASFSSVDDALVSYRAAVRSTVH